jgi:hypothetical protein
VTELVREKVQVMEEAVAWVLVQGEEVEVGPLARNCNSCRFRRKRRTDRTIYPIQ